MPAYLLNDILNSTERHKLYLLHCNSDEFQGIISSLQSKNVPIINLSHEVCLFIEHLKEEDYAYLHIEVYDFIKKLIDEKKSLVDNSTNEIVAIHNLGILLEPSLELKAAQLLKDFSKSTAIIIIWDNLLEQQDRLNWQNQKQSYFLDFSDIKLKKLNYEI